MTIQHVRDLAIKIMGLYFLSQAFYYFTQIPWIIFSFDKNSGDFIENYRVIIISTFLCPLIFYSVIGFLLTFGTSRIITILWGSTQESQELSTPPTPSLQLWIILIGLFFFFKSFGSTVTQLGFFLANKNVSIELFSRQLCIDLLTLALSIVCMMKAQVLESFLQKRIAKQ